MRSAGSLSADDIEPARTISSRPQPSPAPRRRPGAAPRRRPGAAPRRRPGVAPRRRPGVAPRRRLGVAPRRRPGVAPGVAPSFSVRAKRLEPAAQLTWLGGLHKIVTPREARGPTIRSAESRSWCPHCRVSPRDHSRRQRRRHKGSHPVHRTERKHTAARRALRQLWRGAGRRPALLPGVRRALHADEQHPAGRAASRRRV